MKYQVVYGAAAKEVQVIAEDASVPAGFKLLQTFEHPKNDTLMKHSVSHVLYSHVQEALYHEGIETSQLLKITFPAEVVPSFISGGPTTLDVVAGTEGVLEVYSFPTELSDIRYSFIANISEKVLKINLNTGKWAAVGPGKGSIRIEHVSTGVHVDIPVVVKPATA